MKCGSNNARRSENPTPQTAAERKSDSTIGSIESSLTATIDCRGQLGLLQRGP